jgi:hypothetical protein
MSEVVPNYDRQIEILGLKLKRTLALRPFKQALTRPNMIAETQVVLRKA